MIVNFTTNERVRVNVRSLANAAAVRKETRNGRDVLVVPSATLPDNVVMNRVRYPAEEIANSFAGLNRSPAPFGHPMIGGKYVSARDPEGINLGWIGAWNENVRRENGRVFLDKVIDVARANQSEEGKAVLAAIEAGEPIPTSTGLLCNLEAAEESDEEADYIARNMRFDHDAIIIGVKAAAMPEQGVGMLVNDAGEQEEIKVINSALADAERDLVWAAESAVRAVEKLERAPLVDRIVSAIKSAVRGDDETRETSSNNGDETMADKAQFEELSAKVNALSEANEKIGETIANAVSEAVKPLIDAQAEMKANQEAEAKAKHEALVEQVVNANIPGFGKEVAEKMDSAALQALANMQGGKKAAPLASGFAITNAADEDDFSPLAGIKGAN